MVSQAYVHVLSCLTDDMLTHLKVHAEPSPDKETYAKDVAEWILARSEPLESGPAIVRSNL